MAIPEKLAGESQGDEDAFVLVSTEATSTSEALRYLGDRVPRPLYLGELKAIVFGNELAKQSGITEPINGLIRSPEVRGKVWLAVAEGKAIDLLKIRTKQESLPAVYVESLLETGMMSGHTSDSRLSVVWARLDSIGNHPLLPILKPADDSIEIGHGAVFLGDRMVGDIDHKDIHAYAVATGMRLSGVFSTPSPRGQGRLYVLTHRIRRSVDVRTGADGTIISLLLKADANVIEDSGDRPGNRGGTGAPGKVASLEAALSRELEDKVLELIMRFQKEYGADVFGFFDYAGRLKLEPWKWNAVFPSATVRVKAIVKIRKFGLGGV